MDHSNPVVPRPRRSAPETLDGRLDRERVVVGVDGSAASVQALTWALHYAAENGATVEVVTAWPVGAPVFVREVPGHFSEARWTASQAQARAIAHALSLVGEETSYTKRLENAGVVQALLEAAKAGDLIVLGTDRVDGEHERGSSVEPLPVTVQRLAECPVVLIPYRAPSDPEIVTTHGPTALTVVG